MIRRTWRGWTTPDNADAYESYLRDDLFPRLARELSQHGYRLRASGRLSSVTANMAGRASDRFQPLQLIAGEGVVGQKAAINRTMGNDCTTWTPGRTYFRRQSHLLRRTIMAFGMWP